MARERRSVLPGRRNFGDYFFLEDSRYTSQQEICDASEFMSDRVARSHQWQTRTGICVCVSTLVVTLPSTIAAIPLLPCEAMTMRSQPLCLAVSMIAS